MKKFIDLSHTVTHGMITYEGLPGPLICDYLTREASQSHYADGTTFHIGKIEMVANTGTYLDSPFHRYEKGKDLSQLPLTSLADLDGVIFRVDVTDSSAIGADVFRGHDVHGKAVLVNTNWSRHWGTEAYFDGHPFLTAEAAQWLRDAGATLVGIDSLNIDDISGGERPVHSILLGAEIPIVEHMCHLESVPNVPFKFHAVPVKVKQFGTFPVRAYAIVGSGA